MFSSDGRRVTSYKLTVSSFSLKVLSNVKSKLSTYLVIPSTFSFGARTLTEGFAQLIESISPLLYSFLKIGLFLTQTQSFTFIEDIWGYSNWSLNLCLSIMLSKSTSTFFPLAL